MDKSDRVGEEHADTIVCEAFQFWVFGVQIWIQKKQKKHPERESRERERNSIFQRTNTFPSKILNFDILISTTTTTLWIYFELSVLERESDDRYENVNVRERERERNSRF